MSETEHAVDWLQGWYAVQCDGDWEHEWGVKIESLDNPGWAVSIDLRGTPLEGRDYPLQDIARSESDWVWVRTLDETFQATCGPGNLTEVLTSFRSWAKP